MFMHGSGFGGWLFLILNILFYAAIFVGIFVFIIWAIRQMGSRGTTQKDLNAESTPEEILKARYARGEITREEYLAIRDDLRE